MPVQRESGFVRNSDPTGAAAKPRLTLIFSPSWHFAGNLWFPYRSMCCGVASSCSCSFSVRVVPLLQNVVLNLSASVFRREWSRFSLGCCHSLGMF